MIALAGSVGENIDQLLEQGIQAVIPISDGPITLEESLIRAPGLIAATAARTTQLLQIGKGLCW